MLSDHCDLIEVCPIDQITGLKITRKFMNYNIEAGKPMLEIIIFKCNTIRGVKP